MFAELQKKKGSRIGAVGALATTLVSGLVALPLGAVLIPGVAGAATPVPTFTPETAVVDTLSNGTSAAPLLPIGRHQRRR